MWQLPVDSSNDCKIKMKKDIVWNIWGPKTFDIQKIGTKTAAK